MPFNLLSSPIIRILSLELEIEKNVVKYFDLIFVAVEIRVILLRIEIIKRYFSLVLLANELHFIGKCHSSCYHIDEVAV